MQDLKCHALRPVSRMRHGATPGSCHVGPNLSCSAPKHTRVLRTRLSTVPLTLKGSLWQLSPASTAFSAHARSSAASLASTPICRQVGGREGRLA